MSLQLRGFPQTGRISREQGMLQKAISSGALPPGSTIADYRNYVASNRLDQTRSAEQSAAAKQQIRIALENQGKEDPAAIARLRSIAEERGALIPQNPSRDYLIAALNLNPEPDGALKAANKAAKVPGSPIRLGILTAARINYRKISEKLIWGMIPLYDAAVKAGFQGSAQLHANRMQAWGMIRNIHIGAGGNPAKLRDAILKAKPNQQVQTGEPVTTAATITAAAAALEVVVKALRVGDDGGIISDTAIRPKATPAANFQAPARTPAQTPATDNQTPEDDPPRQNFFRKYWWQLLLAGAAAGGATIYLIRRNKNKPGDDAQLQGIIDLND